MSNVLVLNFPFNSVKGISAFFGDYQVIGVNLNLNEDKKAEVVQELKKNLTRN